MKNLICIIALTILMTGCKEQPKSNIENVQNEKTEANDSEIIKKIYVSESGAITLNDTLISLQNLDKVLENLKIDNGNIYYSRANMNGAPPPESMGVIKLSVKHKLPIKFYTDSTFTVSADVNSHL